MKNLFLSILLATILFSCGQKRPSVIENPVFETWSADVAEITKIELTDSATILSFDVVFQPGSWIRVPPESHIKEHETDNILKLTKAVGITPGEQFTMPDSGRTAYQLYFPPLAPEVTKIDFIECDHPDCWKIRGISLMPETNIKMASAIQSDSKNKKNSLPKPGFYNQPAKVSGQLFGFNKSMMPYEITFYSSNLLTGAHQGTKLTAEEDGSFSGEVPLYHPSVVYTDKFGALFLIPGKDLNLSVDLKKKARYESRYRKDKQPGDSLFMTTSGSPLTILELKEVNNAVNSIIQQESTTQEVAGMTPDEFKNYMVNKWHSTEEKIKDKNLTEAQHKVLSSIIQNQILMYLMNYESFLKQAHFKANNISFDQWREVDFKVEKPGNNYYSFVPEIFEDNLTYDMNFSGSLKSILNLPLFGTTGNLNRIEKASAIASIMKQNLNKNNNLITEAVKSQVLFEEIQELHYFSEEDKKQLKTLFSDEFIANYLITESDDLKKLVETNKAASGDGFVIHEIPATSEDKVFEAILAEHKGKTIVVDFWATWCGPCLGAMEQIKPLKEEMKEEDVVFVYLTGETSPTGTWNKMVPDIHGHHYRVNNVQWQYWYENLKIEGVPTFMIFDKEGKQIARHTGFPGVDAMREAITKG